MITLSTISLNDHLNSTTPITRRSYGHSLYIYIYMYYKGFIYIYA
jgi:hypothetical protein